jgi:hypothetical protein
MRDEEIELDGLFVLLLDARPAVRADHRSCGGLWLCSTSWEAVSFGYVFVCENTAKCRPLLRLSDHKLFIPSLDLTSGDIQRDATNSLQPYILRHSLTIRVDSCNWRVDTRDLLEKIVN